MGRRREPDGDNLFDDLDGEAEPHDAAVDGPPAARADGAMDRAPRKVTRPDPPVDLARALAALPLWKRSALARACRVERKYAGAPVRLARVLEQAGWLTASVESLDEDARSLLYALCWTLKPGPDRAAVARALESQRGWPPARAEAAVARLRDCALVALVGPHDALYLPTAVAEGLAAVALARLAQPVSAAAWAARAARLEPEAIVADVARLIGRARLGLATTAAGRLTKRAQGLLRPYVTAADDPARERLEGAWDEYDPTVALPLALAAMLDLVRWDAHRRMLHASAQAEPWLGLAPGVAWLSLLEAWWRLLPRGYDARVAIADPRAIEATASALTLSLSDLARLRFALGPVWPPADSPGALPLLAATGYRLGAFELVADADADPRLPSIRATAVVRGAGRDHSPALGDGREGRVVVTGSGEVVATGLLPSAAWADLAAFCEVVSVDRAAILRPTRTSVAAATAAGLDAGEFLRRLEALAGPLPQATAFQVRDWGRRRTVTLRVAVLAETSDDVGDLSLDRLPGMRQGDARRLGPGLWEVPTRRSEAVRSTLSALGLRVEGDRLTGPVPVERERASLRPLTMPWPGPDEEARRVKL